MGIVAFNLIAVVFQIGMRGEGNGIRLVHTCIFFFVYMDFILFMLAVSGTCVHFGHTIFTDALAE